MTTTSNDVPRPDEWGGRLTPSDVHHVLFTRAGLGRRGYDEVEVDVFLERVQQELTRLIGEKADLRDEVARLRAQLASAGSGSGAASAVDTVTKEEAQLQAVRLLAAAQQTADTYVADAEKYSQRLTLDAREHSEQMVAEARDAAKRMVAEAERLAGETAARTIDGEVVAGAGPSKEELDQQVAYLKTFGQVVRVQLRAYLEALLRDVEDEWGRADPGVVLAAPPSPETALRWRLAHPRPRTVRHLRQPATRTRSLLARTRSRRTPCASSSRATGAVNGTHAHARSGRRSGSTPADTGVSLRPRRPVPDELRAPGGGAAISCRRRLHRGQRRSAPPASRGRRGRRRRASRPARPTSRPDHASACCTSDVACCCMDRAGSLLAEERGERLRRGPEPVGGRRAVRLVRSASRCRTGVRAQRIACSSQSSAKVRSRSAAGPPPAGR
jgi:DivIVA domain-containing protein